MKKLIIYRREDLLFDWRLVAGNGHVIATSGGQGYTRRRVAEKMGRECIMPLVPIDGTRSFRVVRADVRVVHDYSSVKVTR